MSTTKLTRLEYMNARGAWMVGHAGIALLDPARYVERLHTNGKIARATVLSDTTLQATDEVYETPGADLI